MKAFKSQVAEACNMLFGFNALCNQTDAQRAPHPATEALFLVDAGGPRPA